MQARAGRGMSAADERTANVAGAGKLLSLASGELFLVAKARQNLNQSSVGNHPWIFIF